MSRGECACGAPVHSRGLCGACYQRDLKAHKLKVIVPRRASENFDAVNDTSGERCRCGLRLPCNDCLPVTIEGQMERMARGSNWPEQPA